jgi:hypothetical protein
MDKLLTHTHFICKQDIFPHHYYMASFEINNDILNSIKALLHCHPLHDILENHEEIVLFRF